MSEIEQNIKKHNSLTLKYLIEQSELSEVAFPILPQTYTLWRKCAYNYLET